MGKFFKRSKMSLSSTSTAITQYSTFFLENLYEDDDLRDKKNSRNYALATVCAKSAPEEVTAVTEIKESVMLRWG
jgi:hypothetical protein